MNDALLRKMFLEAVSTSSAAEVMMFVRDILSAYKPDYAEAHDQYGFPTDAAKLAVIKKILE